MIIKNEIPILEFDDEKRAVLEPTHEGLSIRLPEKCVYLFFDSFVENFALSNGAEKVAAFESATKEFPVFVMNYHGEEIVICQAPVGAAAAAQFLDWLIGYGVRTIIASGSCGCLEEFPEGYFLVPAKALRGEGTSYHYAPPSRFIEISEKARSAIESAIKSNGMKYLEVTTWSTDGFYRETAEMIAYRKSEGCSVVEMECSALAAVSAFRGAVFGMILYTADSLADTGNYDERNWGGDSEECAVRLALESLRSLE